MEGNLRLQFSLPLRGAEVTPLPYITFSLFIEPIMTYTWNEKVVWIHSLDTTTIIVQTEEKAISKDLCSTVCTTNNFGISLRRRRLRLVAGSFVASIYLAKPSYPTNCESWPHKLNFVCEKRTQHWQPNRQIFNLTFSKVSFDLLYLLFCATRYRLWLAEIDSPKSRNKEE
jgi:hypothetical protein